MTMTIARDYLTSSIFIIHHEKLLTSLTNQRQNIVLFMLETRRTFSAPKSFIRFNDT